MAPPKGSSTDGAGKDGSKEATGDFVLSKRELDVALYGWQCIEGDIKIDFKKLAQIANFNTISGAQKQWSLTRLKLKIASRAATTKTNDEDAGDATPKATTTPKRKRAVGKAPGSAAKKGRTKKEATEDDENFIVDDTPGSAVRAFWTPEGEGEGEGDECPASPTPVPKKRGRPSKKKASGTGAVVANKVEQSEDLPDQQQDKPTEPTEPGEASEAVEPDENNEEEI